MERNVSGQMNTPQGVGQHQQDEGLCRMNRPTIIVVFLSGIIAGITLCSVYYPTDSAISRIIEGKRKARVVEKIKADRAYDNHKIPQLRKMFEQGYKRDKELRQSITWKNRKYLIN